MRRIQGDNVAPGDLFKSRDTVLNEPGTIVKRQFMNDVQESEAQFIESTGDTVDITDYEVSEIGDPLQKSAAVSLYSATASHCIDTGVADAYVLDPPSLVPIRFFTDGMRLIFEPINTNTGSSTVDYNSLGVKSIINESGDQLSAGQLTINGIYTLEYNSIAGAFLLVDIPVKQIRASSNFNTVAEAQASKDSSRIYDDAVIAIGNKLDGSYTKYIVTTTVGDVLLGDINLGDGLWANPLINATEKTYTANTGRANNRGVISFIFDDAFDSAFSIVAPLFEARGVRCGFAIPFRLLDAAGFSTKTQIKDLFSRGFEIGSHTLNNTSLIDATLDPATGESEIVGGYKELAALGVDPKFFVAVSSALDPSFADFVKINHDLSFPRGTAASGSLGVQDAALDRYDLKRDNLFSIGVAEAKLTIDHVVANGGYAQFYDHDPLQIGFANSLSTVDLTEVLDYAIANGALILNPSDALDFVSADLLKSRDPALDSKNSKNTLISNANLISDSEFTSFGESNGTLTPLTAWITEKTGVGTVVTSRLGGSAGALNVRISADTSVGDTITVKNATVRFDSVGKYWRSPNICFSIDLTGDNNNFEDFYTSVIGIQLRRTDNDAIITEKVVNIDLGPFPRPVYVVVETPVGIDFYVTSFYRVTVVTPTLVVLVAAKPVVSLTPSPAPYSSTIDFPSRVSKDALLWMMDSTILPSGALTNIPVTVGAIQNDIGRFDAGSFWPFQIGSYRFDVVNIATGSGNTAGARIRMGLNLNGATNHEFEDIGQGVNSAFKMNTTLKLNPLDFVSPYIVQHSGVSVTTDGGATCDIRVTYLGQ